MAKIAIIGAMDEEINLYFESIKGITQKTWKIFTFYTGKYHGHDVILVKCGIGKVFASMICQHIIDFYSPDFILFTGVAGALNKSLKIGDVVVSEDSAHHDMDAQALGFEVGRIPYTNYRFSKSEKKLLDFALNTKLKSNKIIKGRILTGDQFMTQKHKFESKHLTDVLKGDCVEMEGAALAQVCNINEVPHLIIRTVSDTADGEAVEEFEKFKHVAAKNSFLIVDSILKQLK